MAEEERALTRQGQNRKAELLHHAERLFSERGYADTRMVDIADAAGVTKGNVYWYFETKEALARELVVDARNRLRDAQFEATEGLTSPLEILYVGTRASVEFNVEGSSLHLLAGSIVDAGFVSELRESSAIHADDAVRVLRAGQRRGEMHADEDPISLAQANEGVANQHTMLILRGKIASTSEGAHRAARYVTRAVASSQDLAEAVISRHG